MKKLLLALIAVLLVALAAGWAVAGDYHSGANNICSDCHTMHFSRSHDMSGGSGNDAWQLGTGPNAYLLKDEANKLCLSCHDGQPGVPDVLGNDTNNIAAIPGAGGRSAGALNEVGGVDNYPEYSGHTLGSTVKAPGGTWTPGTEGLECLNCHHQHGKGNGYRNVNSPNGLTISYAKEAEDKTGKDVYETYGPGSSLDKHYGQDYIGLLEPDQTKSGVAAYCKDCHTDFHGTAGDPLTVGGTGANGTEWIRHPNAGADIGANTHGHSALATYSGKLYRVRVMSSIGDWGTQGTAWTGAPTNLTPTCLSCHKAHGNHNAFGLILASGTQPIGEDGDSSNSKAICTQCHIQGGG